MTFHIIIREERREADAPVPEDIAKRRYNAPVHSINADIRTPDGVDAKGAPKFIVTPMPTQLHTMSEEVTDYSNIVYAAEWDMKSPYVTVLAGDIEDIKLAYFGWPMETKAMYEERTAPQPIVENSTDYEDEFYI